MSNVTPMTWVDIIRRMEPGYCETIITMQQEGYTEQEIEAACENRCWEHFIRGTARAAQAEEKTRDLVDMIGPWVGDCSLARTVHDLSEKRFGSTCAIIAAVAGWLVAGFLWRQL